MSELRPRWWCVTCGVRGLMGCHADSDRAMSSYLTRTRIESLLSAHVVEMYTIILYYISQPKCSQTFAYGKHQVRVDIYKEFQVSFNSGDYFNKPVENWSHSFCTDRANSVALFYR